jgi:hypothetical protein
LSFFLRLIRSERPRYLYSDLCRARSKNGQFSFSVCPRGSVLVRGIRLWNVIKLLRSLAQWRSLKGRCLRDSGQFDLFYFFFFSSIFFLSLVLSLFFLFPFFTFSFSLSHIFLQFLDWHTVVFDIWYVLLLRMFFYVQYFFSFKDIIMRKLENLRVICVVFLWIRINDEKWLKIIILN